MTKSNRYIKCLLFSLVAVIASLAVMMSCTVQAEAKTNWKKLYKNFIAKDDWCQESASSARLIYINNDSIPEIYIEGAYAAAGNALLTIYKGKVYFNYLDGHAGLSYVNKKGLIHMAGGNMDRYYDHVGKLSKGKIVYTKSGYYGAEDNSDVQYDSNGMPLYDYYWDDKDVSQKTYAAKLKKAMGKYKYKYAGDYDKMIDMQALNKKLS